jgi:hypothetical protein
MRRTMSRLRVPMSPLGGEDVHPSGDGSFRQRSVLEQI